MVSVALLVWSVVTITAERDWRTAVTVDGVSIDRAAVRNRLDLDAALESIRDGEVRTRMAAGEVSAAEGDRLLAFLRPPGDPIDAAIGGLVRDEVLRASAQRLGLDPPVDASAEVRQFATAALAVQLRWVTIRATAAEQSVPSTDWPPYPGVGAGNAARDVALRAAAERVHTELANEATPDALAEALRHAGWNAAGFDRWVPAFGPVEGAPDSLVAAARSPAVQPGQSVGPVDDPLSGGVAVGMLIRRGPAESAAADVLVRDLGVEAGALEAWARARAAEHAIRDQLLADWTNVPQQQARAVELVVGSNPSGGTTGRFAALSHLVVGQLPGEALPAAVRPIRGSGGRSAAVLAQQLSALSGPDRVVEWQRLTALANRTAPDDPLLRSGELGFFTADQLIVPLGAVATAETAGAGTVLGPFKTSVGDELFLVRGRYDGTLDERTNAALTEAMTSPDLSALARQISPPGEASRADARIWRADAEFVGLEAASAAFVRAPAGAPLVPLLLDGEVVVVRVVERRAALLDAPTLDRLLAHGFDRWLADALARAVVVVDADPLPAT